MSENQEKAENLLRIGSRAVIDKSGWSIDYCEHLSRL